MKLTIDAESAELVVQTGEDRRVIPLYSKEAFEYLSQQWIRVGWSQRYSYTFTWFGRPIIQLPEDMIRAQEVIFSVRPDVIVETGVAHGGSAIYYASLLHLIGKGRVVAVDIKIRQQHRRSIEEHPMSRYITLIEGSSTDDEVVRQVRSNILAGDTVMVFLDSNHTKTHVESELEKYAPLVTKDSYIVATDGIMRDLNEVPGGRADWLSDNPSAAVVEFVARHPEFKLETPRWQFNESELEYNVTHWPDAWLRRS